MKTQNEKLIDIVAVRHGNTASEDLKALQAGNAPLSKEDFWQVEESRDRLAGMKIDYAATGATLRMMKTLDAIRPVIKIECEECDTRLDSRTNSNGPDLWPADHDDAFLGGDGYHVRTQKILRVLGLNKLPNGGRALLVTTGAVILPLYVLANGINPISEDHYSNDIGSRFSAKPASIHCFRYFLETGELRIVSLDEVKSS